MKCLVMHGRQVDVSRIAREGTNTYIEASLFCFGKHVVMDETFLADNAVRIRGV